MSQSSVTVPSASFRLERGFTLVEVLVALVITAIGLLALAGMQLINLRNNSGSYLRSQAAIVASDMVDRMRVNNFGDVWDDYLHNTPAAPPPAPAVNCETADCTRAQLAAYDLDRWWTLAAAVLPQMGGTIACNPNPCTANSVFTITVMWDDARMGAANTTCPNINDPGNYDPAVHLLCYQLSFDL